MRDAPPTGFVGLYDGLVRKLGRSEYVLLFGLGLLGGGFGVGGGLVLSDRGLVLAGIGAWSLLVVISGVVIVASGRTGDDPRAAQLLDRLAHEAYAKGGDASFLSGRWKAQWYSGEGAARASWGPEETLDVEVAGPRVVATSFDESTRQRYWIEGRLAVSRTLSMFYWSQPTMEHGGRAGVVLLRVDASAPLGTRLVGRWTGSGPAGEPIGGDVEWTKAR